MNTAIGTAIGNINSFDMAVVQELPSQNISTHTIYLVPKTGETNDVYDEYVYINSNWEMVGNTQIDLSNYVQKTDYATTITAGLVKINNSKGIAVTNTNELTITGANSSKIKAGTDIYASIIPGRQHESAFYGLAKAAGDTTQSQSANSVGTYTTEAKAAIQTMLDVPSNADLSLKADKTDTVLETTLSRGRKDNTTVGGASLAFGIDTEASGYYSVALGLNTTASSQGAFAEGKNTVAHYIAHAEGEDSQALSSWSHAQNLGTIANGGASSASGRHTIANGADSFVFGRYNAEDSYDNWPTWTANTSYEVGDRVKRNLMVQNEPTDVGYHCTVANNDATFDNAHWELDGYHMNYVEIVGNGSEYEDPETHQDVRAGSNAYALEWNGTGHFAGDVYVGCNADSTGGTKLAKITDIPSVPVQDVQIDGTSIVSSGIANIPYADTTNSGGIVRANNSFGITYAGQGLLSIDCADATSIKAGSNAFHPIVPYFQHYAAFYGLAKAAGDSTQSSSSSSVGTYTDSAKAAIQNMLGVGGLMGPYEADNLADQAYASGECFMYAGKLYKATSAITSGGTIIPGSNCEEVKVGMDFVKKTDIANATNPGVVKIESGYGISANSQGRIYISGASESTIKTGQDSFQAIVPARQHATAFYGLAKAAGDTTQSQSDNAVGTYTAAAKTAIRAMLGATSSNVIEVSDTQPTDTDNKIWMPETAPAGIEVPTYAEFQAGLAGKVSDVQINGSSIVNSEIAEIPIANDSTLGVVKIISNNGIAIDESTNALKVSAATEALIKSATNRVMPLTPVYQHEAVFYGLAKAAGDSTQSASSNAVGTYTAEAKAAIQHMLGTDTNLASYESDTTADQAYAIGELFMLNGKLHQATAAIAIGDTLEVGTNCAVVNIAGVFPHDVQINGASIVNNGIANIPYANGNTPGVIMTSTAYGISVYQQNGNTYIAKSTDAEVKAGTNQYKPIVPYNQHTSIFYGLAKAAGDTTQSASSNAVGTYTDNAKASIKSMLGIVDGSTGTVTVAGTTPTITAVENTRYVCGEVSTLSITPPASGICIVRFTSGTTAAVVTVPNTVKFPEWFDITALEADTIYEMCITDGIYGAVMSWAL